MTARACIAALAASLLLTACGSSSSSPTSPEAPTGQPQTVRGNVTPYGTSSHDIQVTRAGTLTVTLTWSGGVDLDLYLTRSDCTGYPPDASLSLARSTATAGNKEEIQWSAAADDRLKLWVDNFSPTAAADYTITTVVR
jgi:hypothetical protein